MRARALAVIRQNLDYPAVCDLAMAATLDHHAKLDLQGVEAVDALLHLRQPGARNGVGRAARLVRIILQGQERADCLDFESQFARVADEGQAPQIAGIERPPVALSARRRWQQADLLVIGLCG